MTVYRTQSADYTADVDDSHGWLRNDFTYLGIITHKDGWSIGWAWHHDGRSIDASDRAFDLVGFPQAVAIAEQAATKTDAI